MELSPQTKQQIDTVLRMDKWTSWGVGIIGVSAIIGMLIYASYWEMPDSFFLIFIFSIFSLVVTTEVMRFRMWRRFVKNEKARKLLTLRYTAYLLGLVALGYYGVVVFNQTSQPQSFQAFLLSQAFFWGATFFGKWLDCIIQKHDGNYLTDQDIKAIKEAREIEKEERYG
ncbi:MULTISPECIES: hypothetical protein [unclassified Exiguobacterium]|uniref:hypothetical protein n=1 Tax=unclassified Exiguobacterium TaxID=2644629 RepID=UPI00103CFC78|nr:MULTISPECIES: hypothetical protein [unclassified Exiguobacterium]TCI43016.1 hypothetical protein EVJ31_12705 [Exiguobacterium sp. SH5S32]TCI49802.1 hypothetical protein EVJ25_13210 [Exiguobacterium sp. SH1S4]TCI68037.1 hypothetical protein EVJ23_12695 [Exiguobacterium sp. SH1S1]